jgi:AraC-like DNA-binding protein
VSPPVIATLLPSARARAALRAAVPRGRVRLASCRHAGEVERMVARELTDAVVVDARAAGARELLARCHDAWPRIPRFAYAAFRPDDGELLARCAEAGATPIVEGVEDPVVGDFVLPFTASAARQAEIAEAPRLLRLTEALQQRAWLEVLRRVGGRLRALDVARSLKVSREHLSRQFGAGGAPNLKRVIDLARTVTAADLLGNPGYSVRAVARMLGFASASHLAAAARRIAGISARGLAAIGPRGVLAAFVRGRTRSRSGG